MHNYESARGHLPGAIRDWTGRPLLSVRVALLPYLEEDKMYREFQLDEPWDSPHNLQFLDRIPPVYRSVGNEPPHASQTFYRMVTGPQTALDKDGRTLSYLAVVGAAESVVFIEAGEAVPWTKPEEFEYHPDRPLPPLGGIFDRDGWVARRRGLADGTQVAFADGHIEFFPRDTSEETWRQLMLRPDRRSIKAP